MLPLGLAAALVAAGCGSTSPSKAYAKKLESTCSRYVSTETPTTGDPLAQVRQVLHNLDRLLPQLAALEPTPETRADSRRLLADMRRLRAIQAAVFADLKNGVQRDFSELERRYERVAARLHATAADLDVPSCSRAANPRDSGGDY